MKYYEEIIIFMWINYSTWRIDNHCMYFIPFFIFCILSALDFFFLLCHEYETKIAALMQRIFMCETHQSLGFVVSFAGRLSSVGKIRNAY